MNKNTLTSYVKAHYDLLLFAGSIVFFLCFPKLDLWVASQFFDSSFYWNDNILVKSVYQVFAKIHIVFLLLLIGFTIYYLLKKLPKKMFACLYLLCCLVLGPGILVNAVLKDNSVGRPRPVHIVEFNGDKQYTPVFHYSGACKKNCSFVSGHAAIGFYAMAIFWVTRRKKWLLAGIALGAAVGFTRIIQGGHFLSDVIFAGWAVYFTCSLLYKVFQSKLSHS